MEDSLKDNRIIYFDLLRILAVFSVVILHVSAQNWYLSAVSSFEWNAFNVYESLSRFSVPVLVMISGVFFLDPNKTITIKKLYKKNILRLGVAYISWSFFYSIAVYFLAGNKIKVGMIKYILEGTLNSTFHLWFLPMLIGLYVLTPFIRILIQKDDKNIIKYFLVLFIILRLLIPTIIYINYENIYYINSILSKIPVKSIDIYVGYFITGYILYKSELSKKTRIIAYIAGIASLFTCMFLTYKYSLLQGSVTEIFYSNSTITTFLMTGSVFIFFKYEVSKWKWPRKQYRIIVSISKCSFGIYLLHVFFLYLFAKLGLNTLSYNPVLAVLLNSLAIYIVSLLISFGLNKIPVINKYIV